MSRLTLKVLRDIRGLWTRVLLIGGVVGLGIATYASGYMGHDTLSYTRDSYFDRLHLADVQLWTRVVDPEELPDFTALTDLDSMVRRFFTPGSMEKKDGTPLTLGLVYVEPREHYPVGDLEIVDGKPLSKDDPTGVVIERSFATIYEYKIGDKIVINPYSNPREVTVRGIAISPEFLVPTSHPDVFIPAKGSLGVIFLSMALITDVFDAPMYNDLLFRAKPGVSEERLQRQVLDLLAGTIEVKKIIPRAHQYSALYINENLRGYVMFIPINLTVFGLVALLVTFLTIHRMITNQATEIGTLLALGYSPGRILRVYMLFGVAVSVVATVLGGLATAPLMQLLAVRYGDAMGLPTVLMTYRWHHLGESILIGCGVSMVCTLLPLLPILRLDPQTAIRGVIVQGFKGLPRALQPIFDLVTAGSTARRFALRNIFRRPGLSGVIVFLIAAAIAMSASFVISLSSWRVFADTTFEKEEWDALVGFRVPLAPADADPILATKGVTRVLPYVTGYAVMHDGDYDRDTRIMGIMPPHAMRSFTLYEGRYLGDINANEILVNGNFNRTHTYHANTTVTLEVGKKKIETPVVGLINDTTLALSFMPFNFARQLLDRGDKIDGFTATTDPTVPSKEMEKRFYAHEMVTYVALKQQMKEVAHEFMRMITAIVQVSLGISYVLAILFMLVGVSMTVMERINEYATLRALGFTRRLVWLIVYYEIVLEGLAAILLSIPLTYVISEYLRHKMGRAWFLIDYQYTADSFLRIAGPALVFLVLAAIPQVRAVLKVPLSVALRLKAFG